MTALDQLETHFAEIIALMPREFDSHDFILKLAHQKQRLYVQALGEINSKQPFMVLHGKIAKRLKSHPELVTPQGKTTSPDIFGNPDSKAEKWRKV